MNKDENWSDYWQAEGASGEVFVNKDGNKHEELAYFWGKKLADLKPGTKIIDLACGAGSIFSDLKSLDDLELYAADISEVALNQLKQRLPQVDTYCCSAENTPFDDESFDFVVSQFGIEYAGITAFEEAARLVKANGELLAVSHIADGYIDSRNKLQLDGALLAKELAFIDKSIAVVDAMYGSNQTVLSKAGSEFKEVEPHLAAYLNVADYGIHAHLYNGTREMLSNTRKYLQADIKVWLQKMQLELEENILRLTEMRKAASNHEDITMIEESMKASGLTNVECKKMQLSDHELPVAWIVSAHKPLND